LGIKTCFHASYKAETAVIAKSLRSLSSAEVERFYVRLLQKTWRGWLWFIALEGYFTLGMLVSIIAGLIAAFTTFRIDAERFLTDPYQVPVSIAIALYASIRSRKYIIPVIRGRLTLPQLVAVGLIGMLLAILGQQFVYFLNGDFSVEKFSLHEPFITDGSFSHFFDAVIYAPILEELAWQGVLQTWLQRLGPYLAILGTTVPFTLEHAFNIDFYFQNLNAIWLPENFFGIASALFIFALIRQYTKSLGAAMIGHAATNFVILSFYR